MLGVINTELCRQNVGLVPHCFIDESCLFHLPMTFANKLVVLLVSKAAFLSKVNLQEFSHTFSHCPSPLVRLPYFVSYIPLHLASLLIYIIYPRFRVAFCPLYLILIWLLSCYHGHVSKRTGRIFH